MRQRQKPTRSFALRTALVAAFLSLLSLAGAMTAPDVVGAQTRREGGGDTSKTLHAAPKHPAPPALGDADIRDIREPLPLAPPFWTVYAPVAVGAALLVLGGLVIFWALRRLRRSPDARALVLARLDAAGSELAEGDPARFAQLASNAVREYIESRYGLHAPTRTTEELLIELSRDPQSELAPHRALLADLLAACDAAKFGGFALARDEMATMDASARRFVDETWRSGRGEASQPAEGTALSRQSGGVA